MCEHQKLFLSWYQVAISIKFLDIIKWQVRRIEKQSYTLSITCTCINAAVYAAQQIKQNHLKLPDKYKMNRGETE